MAGSVMNITKSIRVAMAMRGLNQKGLANLLKMNESSLSQLINRQSITTEKLGLIASALNMKASELVALGEDR